MKDPGETSGPARGSNGLLLFAQIESGRPPRIFPPFWGKAAYERFQIPFYLEELQSLRGPGPAILSPELLPLACAVEVLSRTQPPLEFEEVGSTLFSSIDKLELLFLKHGLKADLRAILFHGVEIMPLMIWLATALHPGYRLAHQPVANSAARSGRITRCYQASSYAFSSTRELVEWTAASDISGQGVFFSRGASDETVELMGNRLTLFSLPEFHAGMTRRGFTLVPLRSSSLFYDNIVNCEETYFLAHRLDSEARDRVSDLHARLSAPEDPKIEWSRHAAVEELRAAGPAVTRSSGLRQIETNPSPDPTLNLTDRQMLHSFVESLAMTGRHPGLFTPIRELAPPFQHEAGFCWSRQLPEFVEASDSEEHANRSVLTLLEDGAPMGPLHEPHSAIRTQGGGRISHWKGQLYFSTRDNSDPNTNGRRYVLAQFGDGRERR